jgi:hypothetical protein
MQGKISVKSGAREGLVRYSNAPDLGFLYEVSAIKHPDYWIGDVVKVNDREFVYSYSAGACSASRGAETTQAGYVAIGTFLVAAAIGAKSVTVPAGTHAALTEDELRNGTIVLFDGSTDAYTTTRGIIGNDAAEANAAFVVYLDAPITYAITASTSKCEVYKSAYATLRTGTSNVLAKMGVPTTYVSASGKYFWVQRKGLVWLPPQTGVGASQGNMEVFWRHDGSLDPTTTALGATIPAGSSSQIAGKVIQGSAAGNGPLVDLQG